MTARPDLDEVPVLMEEGEKAADVPAVLEPNPPPGSGTGAAS